MVQTTHGPLNGVRIVEFEGSGSVPLTGMLLADLGCDVVRLRRSGSDGSAVVPLIYRGRSEVVLDVVGDPAARETAMRLIAKADGVLEGFDPGVAEEIGLGPGACLQVNPRLVYGRMSNWGRTGPLAGAPGNDINVIGLSGALHAVGEPDQPVPPLGMVGEFGGAMLLALGVTAGLLAAQANGHGQVVDGSQLDGAASLMTVYYALFAGGRWADARGENLTDGGAPFYRTYRGRDAGVVAVGALEPTEFALLCQGLRVKGKIRQFDRETWPEMTEVFAAAFAERSRDEWIERFPDGIGGVTPVLSMAEAPHHPHNRASGTFGAPLGPVQPMPVPRFSRTPLDVVPQETCTVAEIVARWR
jgi:alpha-methylacyl-CoA racemase